MHSPIPEVTRAEVERAVEDGGALIIDVRSEEELAHGVIPTAVHLPLAELAAALEMSESAFTRAYGFAPPRRDGRQIVYCRSGSRSEAAVALLLSRGFAGAANYRGSYADWFGRLY